MKKLIGILSLLFVFLFTTSGFGAMMFYPKFQAFDDDGDPLSGGLLYTYENGTVTNKPTYSDRDEDNKIYIEQKASDAASIHERVTRGLDGTDKMLKVPLPSLG